MTQENNFDRAMKFLINSGISIDTLHVDDDHHEINAVSEKEAGEIA